MNLTSGKAMGWIAFVITELLVIIAAIGIMVAMIKGINVDISAGAVITLQGTVFVTVFGAVATKNFRKKKIEP